MSVSRPPSMMLGREAVSRENKGAPLLPFSSCLPPSWSPGPGKPRKQAYSHTPTVRCGSELSLGRVAKEMRTLDPWSHIPLGKAGC